MRFGKNGSNRFYAGTSYGLVLWANCLAPELAVFGTPVAVEKGNLERDLLDDIRRCAPAISSC
ncbi:hypothetical protein D3C76_309180 [compost metagenome]